MLLSSAPKPSMPKAIRPVARKRSRTPSECTISDRIPRCLRRAASAVHDPKDQTEHQAQEQTRHQREIECNIVPPDHDVARQVSQSNSAQIGPKQPDHQDYKAEHNQKARHRSSVHETLCVSSRSCSRSCNAAPWRISCAVDLWLDTIR